MLFLLWLRRSLSAEAAMLNFPAVFSETPKKMKIYGGLKCLSQKTKHSPDCPGPYYRSKHDIKTEHFASRLQPLWSGYHGMCWHYGPAWCMFAVNAEITVNASEQAPPAEQYVLNPSGRVVCCSARKNFFPPSKWQSSETHCAHTSSAYKSAYTLTKGGQEGCMGGGRGHEGQASFRCDKKTAFSYVLRGKTKHKTKQAQPANRRHHYHNWLRSWLVDDWFIGSGCKTKKKRRWQLRLFLGAARHTQTLIDMLFRVRHGRLLPGCHWSHKSSPGNMHPPFRTDWFRYSMPPIIFSSRGTMQHLPK